MRLPPVLGAITVVAAVISLGPPEVTADPGQLFEYAVPVPTVEREDTLVSGFDVLEKRDGDTLYVLGNTATGERLRSAGFAPRVHTTVTPLVGERPSTRLVPGAPGPRDAINETYFGGYRTVNAHYAHLDRVAREHPDLATTVTYGQSHLRRRDPDTGYDLRAVCVTKKAAGDCALSPDAPKPRLVMDTQIHAREIAAGDMSWRFLDQLIDGYGRDPRITRILDTTEIWLIPIVNPDAVDYVQQGGTKMMARKNRNTTHGPCTGPEAGIDLNRNWGFKWGTGGSSADPCSDSYKGPGADSEVETQALRDLYTRLFKARGNGGTEPVPDDVTGIVFSIHSTMGAHMFPPGWDRSRGPNYSALSAIGRRMAESTGYKHGPIGTTIYVATGSSLDWAYGHLGVAGIVTELDSCGSFAPKYSCTDKDWKVNSPTFLYLAETAAAPYRER